MKQLRDLKGKALIETRINRVRRGIISDWAGIGDGVIELRIHFGPGYRVYCVDDGRKVLILCAGTKRTQKRDIERAKLNWREYNS